MRKTPAAAWLACFMLILVMTVVAVPPASAAGTRDVIGSPHDLSTTGTGPVKSTETQVCLFCHAPHNVDPTVRPLWNHKMTTQAYTLYSSTTLSASMAQPSAVSKLCLSCHDGTVATGQTIANNRLITTTGSLSAGANLGTDLRNDHPVTFTPVNNGKLVSQLFGTPATTADPAVKLYQGRVECVTCHQPHTVNLDAVARSFLVRSNSGSPICLACHDPTKPSPNSLNGWNSGIHKTATNTVSAAASAGPYGTVAGNACESCHVPHNPASVAGGRLLRGAEEATCRPCHSGTNLSPALLNLMNEFTKTYVHPVVTGSGLHDPIEAIPVSTNRHAECADCHSPHAASNAGGAAAAPGVEAALLGASGVDAASGSAALRPAANEYEICFKCHANSSNKPQSANYTAFGRTPLRVTQSTSADPYNVRLHFASAVSRHNVTQPRSTAGTPSLRANMLNFDSTPGRSLAAGTYLYCTDCHSSNQARQSKGTGPNGPHGSTNTHLLERRMDLETASGGGYSYAAGISGSAALCYKCHDIGSGGTSDILRDSTFSRHSLHNSFTSCLTCHDPHGIQGGSTLNNKRLLNFDTSVVRPLTGQTVPTIDTTARRCNLVCHGQTHSGYSY